MAVATAAAQRIEVAPALHRAAAVGRDRSLDVYKGLLVVGMVVAHSLQLLGPAQLSADAAAVSAYVNLITFSGFLFAFGAGVAASDSVPRARGWGARLLPLSTLLLAYYLSGCAYRLLVDPGVLTWPEVSKVLLFQDVPGYSEFLASFFVLALAAAFARKPLLRLAASPRAVWIAVVVSLLSTRIPVRHVEFAPLGLLVGSVRFAAFPVLNYGLWFVLGAAWMRGGKRVGPRLWALAAACTGAFLAETLADDLPGRFPPSLLWIVGPALLILAYQPLAEAVGRLPALGGFLARAGRGVLLQLLGTNLAIFALQALYGRFLAGWPETLALAFALVLAVEGVREIARR